MKTHRPCVALALVLAAGIMAGKFLPIVLWIWLAMCAVGLVIFFARQISHSLTLPRNGEGALIYTIVFCLGAAWLQQQYLLPPQSVAFLSMQEAQSLQAVEGVVDSDVARQDWPAQRSVFDIEARRILLNGSWRAACGKVRVKYYSERTLYYGQLLRLHGKLQAPFDNYAKSGFSYRQYLQDHGIYWTMRSKGSKCETIGDGQGNLFMIWALKVRHWMVSIFNLYLAPREAGFVAALVLGDRSGMPRDLKAIFVNTGTAHILAISGMNMAVIAALFFFLLRLLGLPRWAQFLGTIFFLFAYAFLSGWSSSVVRACIMSSVILAGFAFEKEGDPLNSLGLAAVILLGLDPKDLFDVGFQLSFGAVAGILLLHASCNRVFKFLPGFIATTMAVSLAAWIGTAAITFYHFRMITPISVLANIPIVPLADLVMLLGLGLAFGGAVWPPLGYVFAGCLKAILSAMVICAAWFNQVPYGHFIFR